MDGLLHLNVTNLILIHFCLYISVIALKLHLIISEFEQCSVSPNPTKWCAFLFLVGGFTKDVAPFDLLFGGTVLIY